MIGAERHDLVPRKYATNICEQVVFMTEGRVIKHPYLLREGQEPLE